MNFEIASPFYKLDKQQGKYLNFHSLNLNLKSLNSIWVSEQQMFAP